MTGLISKRLLQQILGQQTHECLRGLLSQCLSDLQEEANVQHSRRQQPQKTDGGDTCLVRLSIEPEM